MWGDFRAGETLGQAMKEEKNVVWLKRNNNIIGGRDCTDAIMNIVRTPDLEDHLLVIENKHLIEHPCHRHVLGGVNLCHFRQVSPC